MDYQKWLNGDSCSCANNFIHIESADCKKKDVCDCENILLELSKQHTDDLTLQDEIDYVSGAVDTVSGEVDNKLDASAYTPTDLSDYYTKEEVNDIADTKLDASAYTPDEYATEAWVNEQGFIKTVEPLKTINGEILIGEGDIVISGGSGDAYTKAETDELLNNKQNALVSGENIKTINNTSILGSGNIDVQSLTNAPVYSGSALASVSINNPSGLENGYNRISGITSVGAGYMVETRNVDEAAFGVYNLSNSENSEALDYSSGNTLFSVGNGHPHNIGGNIRKHNAFEIRQNGDIYYADTNDTEAEYPYEMPMIKLQDVIKNLQDEINTLKAQINGN